MSFADNFRFLAAFQLLDEHNTMAFRYWETILFDEDGEWISERRQDSEILGEVIGEMALAIHDMLRAKIYAPEAKPELGEDEARNIFIAGWIAGFKHEDQDDAWVECRNLLAAQKKGQNG
jgi:hypothetical protein